MTSNIKANQVRAFTNSQGSRSYYMVVEDGKGKFGALWFRHDVAGDSKPLHLTWSFKISEEHPIIMENANNLRKVFSSLDAALQKE